MECEWMILSLFAFVSWFLSFGRRWVLDLRIISWLLVADCLLGLGVDCDFLEIWDYLASFQIFDDSWALTQLWLEVDLGGYPRAHDYGDVSCKSIFLP